MPVSPADDAPSVLDDGRLPPDCWVTRAWEWLSAKSEISLRPQRWHGHLTGPGPRRRPDGGPRVVVFGMSSDYGNGLLLHVLRQGVIPVGLVTSTRLHGASEETFYAHAAEALDIPYLSLSDVNTATSVGAVAALRPDALYVFSFDQIFAAPLLRVPRTGAVNFHPSLLPRFRGSEPLFWQIAYGESEAGLTAHLLTERIDAGPIVGQVRVPIEPGDSGGGLARRILLAAGPLVATVLEQTAAGRLEGKLPDLSQGSYQRPPQSMALDWRRTAAELERIVRAGRPDAPAFLLWQGSKIEVLDSAVVACAASPGVVVAESPAGPIVGTGDQGLQLRRIVVSKTDGPDPAPIALRVGQNLLGSAARDGSAPDRAPRA